MKTQEIIGKEYGKKRHKKEVKGTKGKQKEMRRKKGHNKEKRKY